MNEKIDKSGITAVWGGRGAGKSTFSQKVVLPLLKGHRVVVIDPMSIDGHSTALEAAKDIYDGAKRVVLKNSNPVQAVPFIYAAWAASTVADPVYIICDEAPNYLDKVTDGLNKVIFQGRHRGFGMLLLGQRPNALAAQIRSQVAVTYWMRQVDHSDVETARKMIGPDLAGKLSTLPQGEFFRHPPK